MANTPRHARILIYSHDSFGLGHLRRCRAIAHALVERDQDVSVLIVSGSPIIGSFDFRARVDFIRVPGVIKLRNGDYTSLNLHIDTDETMALRASIIEHTAEIFDPDLMLIDKEPLGLRGEVKSTLEMLKARGTVLALGLRDVMDDPVSLSSEWERKNVLPALETLYDHIWIYGLPGFCDPLAGLDLPESVLAKMTYTGYLRRRATEAAPSVNPALDKPYILVTPGGGGDGEALVDWVLRAYETDQDLPFPALVVLGPFMQRDRQTEFCVRAEKLADVEMITFDAHLENLMARAVGVVAMGGYNTFCEILSFDKRALLMPRMEPRREQLIRTTRARDLGLVQTLDRVGIDDAGRMAAALRRLPDQSPPSAVAVPGLLDGLDRLSALIQDAIGRRHTTRPARKRA
ncbi:MAG: glycosyltransferase family protein [Inquilinaceae bacterium]